jgi:SH3-like domain-containing protein
MVRHCRSGSWFLAVLSLAIAVMFAPRGRAETLPYRAHVSQAVAELRSGPGDDYYATDALPQGREVEVYQERPDGWCAVRPPEGSFSWVFAQHVQLLAGGLGEVNKEDVASRVGGRLDAQRDVVQVHLAEGEVVQILGADDRDGQTWYKIAPPSGEFRWVHKRNLASDGALEVARPAQADAPTAQTDSWHTAPQEVTLAAGGATGQVTIASHDEAGDSTSTSTVPASASPWQPVSNQSAPAQSAAADAAVSPASPGKVAPDDFARQVDALELRLSQMVAQPTVTWQIDQLEKEGEQLLSRAEDVAQRDLAKGALAKIDRFAAIYRRYQASSAGGQQPATSNQQPASSIAGSQPPTGGQSQYDAVGMLRPVVSKRPGAPQYALVNEQGQVVSFVTPAPDVNLQPYLGRRIGIVGGRGYIPEFQRAHVTASRVAPLGDRVLR